MKTKTFIKRLWPRKYSQKMHVLEITVGAIIIGLPSLTQDLTVSQAGIAMFVFTGFRSYLVSLKQKK